MPIISLFLAASLLPTFINSSQEGADNSAFSLVAPTASSIVPILPTSVSASVPSGSGIGKRGLSYNNASLTNAFSDTSTVSWAYNWDSSPSGTLSPDLEYIPMLWSLKPTLTSVWFNAASSAISSGSKHLFAFNEPDIKVQANITPSDAATGYIEYMNPFSNKAALGSPAVTNGGGSLGLGWLDLFFNACKGRCLVDFINIHWYDSADNAPYFKSYVSNATALAQSHNVSKVWITEFRGNGDVEQQSHFLETVMPWLDSQDQVEGYAWFMCGTGDGDLAVDKHTKSILGQIYST